MRALDVFGLAMAALIGLVSLAFAPWTLAWWAAITISGVVALVALGHILGRRIVNIWGPWILIVGGPLIGGAWFLVHALVFSRSATQNPQPTDPQTGAVIYGALANRSPETFQEEKNDPFPQITLGCLTLAPMIDDLDVGKVIPLLTILGPGDKKVTPISIYIENNMLFANVTLYNDRTGEAFNLRQNRFSVFHPGWDTNHNDRILEVTNEQGVPIFQMIRRARMQLVLNGYIQVFGRTTMFGPRGEFGTNKGYSVPANFLPKLFMYPSWQHPGKMIDPPPEQPKCPPNAAGVSMISKGLEIESP